MKFILYNDEIINCKEIQHMKYDKTNIYMTFYSLKKCVIRHHHESEISELFFYIHWFLEHESKTLLDIQHHIDEKFTL